jgi:hypothetical protein
MNIYSELEIMGKEVVCEQVIHNFPGEAEINCEKLMSGYSAPQF